MRAAITALLTAASLLAAPIANAAPPGTPQLTVGADIKQLIFDWDSVSGAGYYRLLYKVGSGAYKPLIDNIPASNTQVKLSIAVHLQSWSMIRYAVAACNTSGCTNSAAVFPQNLMLDAIGYFKASNTDPGDSFGSSLVLSDDGRTLAVAAPAEDSNAAGVNGNQADNSSQTSGAVYVFRRTSSGWRQEAYLKAGVNHPQQNFGDRGSVGSGKAVAINANGSLLAVGAYRQNVAGIRLAGAVFIYQRSPSGSWSLAATLHSPTPQEIDQFGTEVEMSLDGRTLKVSQFGPLGDPEQSPQFPTLIFVRPGTTWQYSATLPRIFEGDVCADTRLSGDGNTIVASCEGPFGHLDTFRRSGNAWVNIASQQLNTGATGIDLALDFDANTLALEESSFQQPNVVGIYHWTGSNWTRQTGFPPPPISNASGSRFGQNFALSRTGNVLAIGDSVATEDGAGVSPISMAGTERRGAVYVWRRADRSAPWTLRSVVKSPNPGLDRFGISVALCSTGHALAVGAFEEDSKAKGVDGDRTDNSSTEAGAAYLY